MKHNLRKEGLIMCEPSRFEARLQAVDEFDLNSARQKSRERANQNDGEPENWWETEDAYGDPLPKMEIIGNTAVIPIKGIVSQDLPRIFRAFGFVDLTQVRSDISAALNNPSVKSILFHVDSPGGTLRGVPETAQLIATADAVKPCYAYAAGDMCSAAYYIMAGCRGIFTAPSADVGSIGVYTYNVNIKGWLESLGVKVELFKSGIFKAAGLPGTDFTDVQREQIQTRIDRIGADFRGFVSSHREGVSDETMQGQSFMGSESIAVGLCDEVVDSISEILQTLNN